jgi:hypothetical protein
MADPRPQPPVHRMPLLTEVVMEGATAAPRAPAAIAPAVSPAWSPADEARIVDTVMAGLQQRVDQMFEFRLREALGPVLARAADLVVNDARDELAHTLRDVVARAVTQELARRRHR